MNGLKYHLRLIQFAFLFYTRIPFPNLPDALLESETYHIEKLQNQCSRYFILVGFIVGLLSALVFYLASLVLPVLVAVTLSTIFSIFITGAFHEDGLADSLDGLGGGWSKEQILDIMKDSRIGTYGSAGLLLTVFTKISALFYIATASTSLAIVILILAHMTSRWWSLLFMTAMDYVRLDELSKSKPITKGFGLIDFAFSNFVYLLLTALTFYAFAFAASPQTSLSFSFSDQVVFFLILIAAALLSPLPVLTYFYLKIKKWLQGYTGDILGAIQQLAEVNIYLGTLIFIKVIHG